MGRDGAARWRPRAAAPRATRAATGCAAAPPPPQAPVWSAPTLLSPPPPPVLLPPPPPPPLPAPPFHPPPPSVPPAVQWAGRPGHGLCAAGVLVGASLTAALRGCGRPSRRRPCSNGPGGGGGGSFDWTPPVGGEGGWDEGLALSAPHPLLEGARPCALDFSGNGVDEGAAAPPGRRRGATLASPSPLPSLPRKPPPLPHEVGRHAC